MSKNFVLLLIILMGLFRANAALAAESFEASFAAGLQNYTQKKYEQALEQFMKAREDKPKDPAVLMNLALTYKQLNQLGRAIGFARQSVYLNPLDSLNQKTLAELKSQLEVKDIPHEIDFFEQLESSGFFKIPAMAWQILALFFLLLSLNSWRQHFRQRRQADELGSGSRPFPFSPLVMTFLWISMGSFSAAHSYHYWQRRATVVEKKAELLSAPSLEATLINEVPEGLEVLVLDQKEDWLQIKYPGTQAGWVQKKSILFAY